MNHGSTLGLLAAALALAATGYSGCHRGSDPERAAAERAKMRATLASSNALIPYRTMKVLLRAQGATERPKELARLIEQMPNPDRLPVPIDNPEDAKAVAAAIVDLAVLLYEARAELARHDEDRYPLLWTAWTNRPVLGSWYDNDAEHLALASLYLLNDFPQAASKPATLEFVFYELDHAELQPGWPVTLRLWSHLVRGLAFSGVEAHFAAEEELAAYVDLVEAPSFALALRRCLPGAPPELPEILRAAGHLAHAWSWMGLGRDGVAADSLERALVSLSRAGIDNEATYWTAAFVHYRHRRFAEASRELERLAGSPLIDETTRASIRASLKNLKEQRPAIFGKARAGALIVRALLAGAGGTEKILAMLLGDEASEPLRRPLAWLVRARDGLARYATPDALAIAARSKAREAASSKVADAGKPVPTLRAQPSTAPAATRRP